MSHFCFSVYANELIIHQGRLNIIIYRRFFVEHIELDLCVSSQSDLRCEGRGLSKIAFFCLNYTTPIWSIGLIFLVKHMHMISKYNKILFLEEEQ